jgi:hypothetical protein
MIPHQYPLPGVHDMVLIRVGDNGYLVGGISPLPHIVLIVPVQHRGRAIAELGRLVRPQIVIHLHQANDGGRRVVRGVDTGGRITPVFSNADYALHVA